MNIEQRWKEQNFPEASIEELLMSDDEQEDAPDEDEDEVMVDIVRQCNNCEEDFYLEEGDEKQCETCVNKAEEAEERRMDIAWGFINPDTESEFEWSASDSESDSGLDSDKDETESDKDETES